MTKEGEKLINKPSIIREAQSILEKIMVKLYLKYIKVINQKKYLIYNGSSKLKIVKSKRVVFFLDYPSAIHFGDTLWFEPLIRLLQQSFNVVICPNSAMQFYFKSLGYMTIEKSSLLQEDFILSRRELAYYLCKYDALYVNFIVEYLTKPLIQQILEQIAQELDLSLIGTNSKPQSIRYNGDSCSELMRKFNISNEEKYIIFNDYVDSVKPRTPASKFKNSSDRLVEYVKLYKTKHNYKIIYTGSEKDLEKKHDNYDFVDIDLRGKTSIEDAFILASIPQIQAYIGYDTFWLHLFNIYDKTSHIMLKPGFSERYTKQIKKYVAIPYQHDENRVFFLNTKD